MKIAILNEISAASRNADILNALEGRGFELLNLGNTGAAGEDELLYIHTGLMSALLLNIKAVDFVVAGCGTGQGFLNSVMQYPGVFCGHLLTPMDAWLFARINAGNCISLALNQGYGWAGEVNLRLIFDQLFTSDTGKGYPLQRAEPQKAGRERLVEISNLTHRSMAEILTLLPPDLTQKALQYPNFRPVIIESLVADPDLWAAIQKILD
jgi:ribose 5-phosphate isomerase RpiB